MYTLGHLFSVCKVVMYAFGLFLLQIHFISRLPYESLRVDLLMLFMVALALELPLVGSVTSAICLGYVVDVFCGRFWGLHVTSYVITVLVVSKVLLRFEMQNPLYQMAVAGVCGLIQGGLLMIFLWLDRQGELLTNTLMASLVARSLVMMVMAPALVHSLSGFWDVD
jgi:rod shape-determining protein MreD